MFPEYNILKEVVDELFGFDDLVGVDDFVGLDDLLEDMYGCVVYM